MASKDEESGFPTPQIPRSEVPGPPSIISSRMTDIASEDGHEHETQRQSFPHSVDMASRPGTARTGASSSRAWAGPSMRKSYVSGVAAKRGSGTSTNAGSTGHAPSLSSRSHVPSLKSNAFANPMSSQRLQMQRGGAPRQSTMSQSNTNAEDSTTDVGGSVTRQSIISNPIAQIRHTMSDDDMARPPPSRGTEMTEQETLDRITANTSPTQGHYPAGSFTDSVRPLQRNSDQPPHNLSVNVDTSYRDLANLPSPVKTPRSFRSSFLLPGKSDQGQQSQNRSTEGAEKLSSSASSPRLRPVDSQRQQQQRPPRVQTEKLTPGRVHQYFDGNTVFCLGGRWQNTRNRPINVATGLFLVIPCVLFYVFEAPWLWHNVSPAIPITFAYLTYICVSSFIHASVSDPGVSLSAL